MSNFLWIDSETTGLYPEKNDIVQLACIPVILGKEQKAFNQFCKPVNWDKIDAIAVSVHGITVDRMHTFQEPEAMLDSFIAYLRSFNTKFVIAGYNVNFDKRFLSSFFTRNGKASEFFELFEIQVHDTYTRAQKVRSLLKTENLKLATLSKHFNIEINAHEAMSDIEATIKVDKEIGSLLGEEKIVEEIVEVYKEIQLNTKFKEPAQLHLHSMYGMAESVPSVEEWIQWCKDTKTPGFSIVDHGPAIATYHMINEKDPDVVGIPGVGIYMYEDKNPDLLFPMNVWATNTDGYFNLMKLASLGYEEQVVIDKVTYPKLKVETVNQYKAGLAFGVADVYGPIGQAILDGNNAEAVSRFDVYLNNFKDQMYIEFNPVSIKETFSTKNGFQKIKKNKLIINGDLNMAYNLFLSQMVDKYQLRCVPVSGAHFIAPGDKLIQECISRNSFESGKSYTESYHAKTAEQLYKELKHQLKDWLTEDMFKDWIDNTHSIMETAKTIEVKFDYHMPKIEIPANIAAQTSDYNEQTRLLAIALAKAHNRWSDDPIYVERFNKELDVIMNNEATNFLPYFLLYEDICTYARSIGILQNIGRGSAGGCLLSYYLKIIHIDPIKAKLPFERFLSHARIRAKSFPDIDCDFGDRTKILAYLEEKYKTGFAQIGTLLKMKTKYAIKDAMWALYGRNREDFEIKQLCELIPDSPQGVDEYDFIYGFTDKEGTVHPGVVELFPDIAAFFQQYPQVEQMVKRLIGIPRGWGRHASAFVVSTIDLSATRLPTMHTLDANTGQMIRVTQYEAHMVEKCGLVKADILGVVTINMVSDCIELVKQRYGIDYLKEDKGVSFIYRLPEDKNVYVDFRNKKTDSSFQFNSSIIKSVIYDFDPKTKEQLSIMTALMRPGSMDVQMDVDAVSGKIDDPEAKTMSAANFYISVRKGSSDPYYIHKDLEPILNETYGVIVYQEQVMSILVAICGYTLEETDTIRSAIAKKKHDVMMACFTRVRENCAKRNWSPKQADALCDQIMAFSRYSFNRSHSRCYAELGYITMFLKHHHPLEWWTSVLNNTDKEEKLRPYVALLGPIIRPPSLSIPTEKFAIIGNTIVAPLSVVKKVGPSSVRELVTKGPFNSLSDYITKVAHNKVNIGHFIALINARAADSLMDSTLPYIDARKQLIMDYVALRKLKRDITEFDSITAIDVFLLEREYNKCFNKTLVEDESLQGMIQEAMPMIVKTHRTGIPLYYGRDIPIISGYKMADGLAKKQYDKEVAMILLFQDSLHKSGKSKKNNKEYNFVKVNLSDGNNIIECTWWDKKRALNWPKNSIVFVKGTLQEGWKGSVQLTVKEMEKIIDVKILSSEDSTRKSARA
jgi:DNA polymerase-3 subunit alpha